MTRQTGDLDAVRHMVAWVVRMVVESFSLFAAAAVFFLYTNWKLALCVLVISPFVFWIIYLFRNRVAPMHAALREKLAQMNTCAQENISGNRVVKAFAREDYEIEKFDRANTDYAETNKATGMVWLKFFPIVESIANLMPVVLLAVGGVFMIRGQLTMGDYVAFSGLIWAIANPMRQMGNIMNEFQRFSAASKKVMELYYSEPKIRDEENAVSHPERFEGKIEFDNVSFQYEDGDLPVLHNISFTAHPNETVAIMGETGCGKTSLINLIPRFYEPTEGQIRIDGIPVEQLKLYDLLRSATQTQIDRIAELTKEYRRISSTDPDSAKTLLAEIAVLCSYIKRRKHLTLLTDRDIKIAETELHRAFNESLQTLKLLGVRSSLYVDESLSMLSGKTATAVFDFYESVIEADILNLTGIQVSLIKANGLRLSLNVCCKADLSALVSGDNIRCEKEDDEEYQHLVFEAKEGDRK